MRSAGSRACVPQSRGEMSRRDIAARYTKTRSAYYVDCHILCAGALCRAQYEEARGAPVTSSRDSLLRERTRTAAPRASAHEKKECGAKSAHGRDARQPPSCCARAIEQPFII